MRARLINLSASLAITCLVASCATSSDTTPPASEAISPSADVTLNRHFPVPEELRPQIDFWRKVYAVWSRGQVVLHDDRHLDLIYEIVDLPGTVYDGYTDAQREFVRQRQRDWQYRLRELEHKILTQKTLEASEEALAARIAATAGSGAVFGASERLRSQRGLRERFKRGLEISGRYDALFREIFREAQLPEDLAYLPHVESSFQAHARSSAGAVGMWQFTRGAARTYMKNHAALDERLDPIASARGAARYLRDAHDTLGDWSLALTSYNHGIGGMQRAKQQFGTDFARIVRDYRHPYFGFASRNFYAEFLAAREIASRPEQFFPEGIRYEGLLDWDRIVLDYPARAAELAEHYDVDFDELIALNAAWTRSARRGRVRLPEGTEIWLPAGTLDRIARIGRLSEDGTLAMAEEIDGSAQ